MSGFWLFLVCLMGLCWGSFLSVLVMRTLKEESILYPQSHCTSCNKPLLWWHKIPIISFLILKGKCYFCNAPISIQYIIFEITGLVIWLFSFNKYVSIYDALAVVIILSMFLSISYSDIKYKKISTYQTIIIAFAGLLFNRFDLMNSILGGIVGAGLVYLFIYLGLKLLKKETFGEGDIYLLGAFGAVVGFNKLFLFLIYALFAELFFVLPKYISNLIKTGNEKTLKYLIYFSLACLFLYVFRNMSFWGSNLIFIGCLIYILYLACQIVQDLFYAIKTQENQSYCPIAPALALACLFFLM
ncbi:prepilin peptidase [bacterium]|nr:prepilin peptidase [bacterium]